MYRDARPSIEARARQLEGEIDNARDELERLEAAVPSFGRQLFPLYHNLDHTLAALGRKDYFSHMLVLGCIGALSLPALPLALLLRPLRGDVRARRAARRRVRRLEGQLEENRRTLLALESS
jgi:hypothetical protein